MTIEPLVSLRQICLDFPETTEKETWGHPTFRVNDKMFVACSSDRTAGSTMTLKAPPGEQKLLLASADRFFYPSYVGASGWIGMNLSKSTDWDEVRELVDDSYRLIAPTRLVKSLDEALGKS